MDCSLPDAYLIVREENLPHDFCVIYEGSVHAVLIVEYGGVAFLYNLGMYSRQFRIMDGDIATGIPANSHTGFSDFPDFVFLFTFDTYKLHRRNFPTFYISHLNLAPKQVFFTPRKNL
jgi:hypothetical protein